MTDPAVQPRPPVLELVPCQCHEGKFPADLHRNCFYQKHDCLGCWTVAKKIVELAIDRDPPVEVNVAFAWQMKEHPEWDYA